MVAAPVLALWMVLGADAPADPNASVAGRIIAVHGEATLTRTKQSPAPIARGDVLHTGDTLKTGADGSLRVLLQDDSVLDLASGTNMKLDSFSYKAKDHSRLARITMFIGKLWARVSPNMGDEQNFHVSTPNAVAGVRGTSLVVDVDKGGLTQVTVVNGSVQVKDSKGFVQLLGALMQSSINKQGQMVHSITPATLNSLRGAVGNIRSAFGSGNAQNRLHTYSTAQAQNPPSTASSVPPPPQKPQLATTPMTNTAPPPPPLDLDPTTNFARLNVQVHVKGAP